MIVKYRQDRNRLKGGTRMLRPVFNSRRQKGSDQRPWLFTQRSGGESNEKSEIKGCSWVGNLTGGVYGVGCSRPRRKESGKGKSTEGIRRYRLVRHREELHDSCY